MSKWIPCNKKLPDESNYYLACIYDTEAADKLPDTIGEMRAVANKRGFEVFGRIKLRDKKTGKIYR